MGKELVQELELEKELELKQDLAKTVELE